MSLPLLNPGETVDIVATGSKKDLESLKKAVAFLKEWGFNPRHSPEIFGEHPLYANTHVKRFDNLKQALYAPDSRIIWALRGGCGTTRLLPLLKELLPPLHKKWVIGFSDVTALHLFLHQNWQWPVIHGPVLNQLANKKIEEVSQEMIQDILIGRRTHVKLNNLAPLNEEAQKESSLVAPLTGGNLSLVQSSTGTFWQIRTESHILLLEDVDEKPYRTAERLEHLRQAGIFKNVKAVIFGEFNFTEPVDGIHLELYPKVLREFAAEMRIPVFSCQEFGHGRTNKPFRLGAPARLKMGPEAFCEIQIRDEG